jgi:hypothetical protein
MPTDEGDLPPFDPHLLSRAGGAANGRAEVWDVFLAIHRAALCGKCGQSSSVSGGAAPRPLVAVVCNLADCSILSRSHLLARDPQEERAQSYRSYVLLLAAYLFNYVALRRLPSDGALVRRLRRRLGLLLGQGQIETWLGQQPGHNHFGALAWALFIGAASRSICSSSSSSSSSNNNYREGGGGGGDEWFSRRLQLTVGLLGLRTRCELEEQLKMFLWDDGFGSSFLDAWWRDCAKFSTIQDYQDGGGI